MPIRLVICTALVVSLGSSSVWAQQQDKKIEELQNQYLSFCSKEESLPECKCSWQITVQAFPADQLPLIIALGRSKETENKDEVRLMFARLGTQGVQDFMLRKDAYQQVFASRCSNIQ